MVLTLLGEYNMSESMHTEHKAFHLSIESLQKLNEDDIYTFIKSGKITPKIEKILYTNLLKYISTIIPKYISCFSNASINGVINIGIDDSCEITGIPSIKSISKRAIQNCIYNSIKKNIKSSLSLDDIKSKIEVDIIKLDIDTNILTDDATNYYKKYSKETINYNNKLEEYRDKHINFLKNHRHYTQKLEKILNITKYRKELIEFIKEFSNSSYQHIIILLNSDEYIKLTQDDIYKNRNDKNNIFYWIAKFRDTQIKKICETKPVKPNPPSIYHPIQIVANLPSMRYKLIKNNTNITYYVIRIYLNFENCNEAIYYKNIYNKKWQYRRRICTEMDNEPGCTT